MARGNHVAVTTKGTKTLLTVDIATSKVPPRLAVIDLTTCKVVDWLMGDEPDGLGYSQLAL
jgi:hypothetical protein